MYMTIVRFAPVLIVCNRTSQFVWLLIIINRLLLVYSAGSEGYHLDWLVRVQANGMVLEEYNRAKKDPLMSPRSQSVLQGWTTTYTPSTGLDTSASQTSLKRR